MFNPKELFYQGIAEPDPLNGVQILLDVVEKTNSHYSQSPDIVRTAFKEVLPHIIPRMYRVPSAYRSELSSRLVQIGELAKYSYSEIEQSIKAFNAQNSGAKNLTHNSHSVNSGSVIAPQMPVPPADFNSHSPAKWSTAPSTPYESRSLAQQTQRQTEPQHELGQAIARIYSDYGHQNIRYLPEELSENSRFDLLVFAWQSGDDIKKIKNRRIELALAGVDPNAIRIIITNGVHKNGKIEGRFEVQIPKENWTPCLLLVWLYEKAGGPNNLRDRMQMLDWLVQNIPKSPAGQLTTTFGLDPRNKPITLTHKKGVFTVGSPDSGKSVSYRSRVTEALLTHTPDTLSIYAIDMKRVTFEPFRDLIYIITDASIVHRFLDALLKEASDRNDEFARVGVTDILQYNSKFPSAPMALFWIIIDEIYKLRDEICKLREGGNDAELIKKIELLTSFSRSVGFCWDIGTQYAAREQAVSPATRNNLTEKCLFTCDDSVAGLVLGSSNTDDLASCLLGEGDALVKAHASNKKTIRAQGFFVPDDPDQNHLFEVLHILKAYRPSLKPSPLLQNNVDTQSLKLTGEDAWATPSSTDELRLIEREKSKWLLIQQVEDYNLTNPGAITKRRLYAAVYGELGGWLTEEQKKAYQSNPVETLQDLLTTPQLPNTDPRTRVQVGGNETTAQSYIEKLRSKYSKPSAD
jgi:hypothetical protein